KDDACATDYAERIVALTPDDTSMTLLAVQLLERNGDQAGLHRAVTYVSRVSDSVKNTPLSEKSPRVSVDEWEGQKKRDQSALAAGAGGEGSMIPRQRAGTMRRATRCNQRRPPLSSSVKWTSSRKTMKARLCTTRMRSHSPSPPPSPATGGRSGTSSGTCGGSR